MPLDPSIALQAKPIDPMAQMGQVMQFKALANQSQMQGMELQQKQQQFQDEQAQRNAYHNNVTVGSDGKTNFDQAGYMKDLAQVAPHLVPKAQLGLNQMNNDQLKAAQEKNASAAQMLQGIETIQDPIKQQQAYTDMKNSPLAKSAGSDQWPEEHDPGFVKQLFATTLSHKDTLENEMKQRELDIKAKQAGMETTKYKAEQNQQTLSALQALRGNPALQRAETNTLSAKNLNDLAEQVRDPNTGQINLNRMNPQQVSLFNHELLRMASGGTGSEADLENLKPGTPQYKLAELRQKLTGNVSGAQAAPYLQQGLDYANSLSKSSGEFLYSNAKHVVDAKRNYLDPKDQQRYDAWLNEMKNGKSFFGDVVGGSQANSGIGGKYIPTPAEAAAELAKRRSGRNTVSR